MRHTRTGRLLMAAALCLSFAVNFACAQTPTATVVPAVQARWPQKLTITVGDIRTRIDGPKLWTLSGIDYQGTMMATEESAYGTVFTIRNVGHLGTAHFLDVPGHPGQVEKERVHSLNVILDDRQVKNFKPAMDLSAESFRMERASDIRGVELQSSVEIRGDVLIETAHIKATKPMDLQKAHPLMYAFTPKATSYVFGGDGAAIVKRGEFLKDGATNASVVKGVHWAAVYDPNSAKGSVCYFAKYPADDERAILLVDAPGVYRKVALYSLVDKVIPVGFEGAYQSVVGFFIASESEWETIAIQRMNELKAIGDAPEKK